MELLTVIAVLAATVIFYYTFINPSQEEKNERKYNARFSPRPEPRKSMRKLLSDTLKAKKWHK